MGGERIHVFRFAREQYVQSKTLTGSHLEQTSLFLSRHGGEVPPM